MRKTFLLLSFLINLTVLDAKEVKCDIFIPGMFTNASGLTSLDLSSFDTSSVTNMSYMFTNASGLTTLDLSSFDTSSVTNMRSMFTGASGLTSLDLSNWNTASSPSSTGWISNMTGTIICNDPDNGGIGTPGSGTVNGVDCN